MDCLLKGSYYFMGKVKLNILGLAHIHSLNLIHRDIKPDNLLFKRKNDLKSLKIADFGLSIFY